MTDEVIVPTVESLAAAEVSVPTLEFLAARVVEPPALITMDDLLNSVNVLIAKEAADKATLESIGAISSDELKNKLLSWASVGFPNVYEVYRVIITPPTRCSDGISRTLADYIEFCSGKPIHAHVELLGQKVSGIQVTFANMGGYIGIVVSKV